MYLCRDTTFGKKKGETMSKELRALVVGLLLAGTLLILAYRVSGNPGRVYLPVSEAYPVPNPAYPEPTYVSATSTVVGTLRAVSRTPLPVISPSYRP